MDRINFSLVNDISPELVTSFDYGHGDTVPIDQTPAKSFNIDPKTGRPMSDLTALLKAQPLDRERLLANMEEFRADYALKPDATPSDVAESLKYALPRLAQMPSELAEYAEFVTSKRLEEAKKVKEADFLKQLDEDCVSSLKKDSDTVVEKKDDV